MSGTAFSIDGRTFSFDLPLRAALRIGSYVIITVADDQVFLGQVLDETVEPSSRGADSDEVRRVVTGRGQLLARVTADGFHRLDGAVVFGRGALEPADPELVRAHLAAAQGADAGIELGEIQAMPGIPATLKASGFGRHTFLCGQSGSGKTYTLGVILERLLLNTDIRIAVIDPNSDYVNLGQLRPRSDTGLEQAAYDELAARYEPVAKRVAVLGGPDSPTQLRTWFSQLSFEQQTMVLGLDPFSHPDEYNAFVRIVERLSGAEFSLEDVLDTTRSSFNEDLRRLGLRIENLGVADLSIWADGADPLVRDTLPDDWRMVVLDLGSLPSYREGSISAAGLLGPLWANRHSRTPTIIVIDEAHNVCPQHPTDANQAFATEHLVKIAGEGRKYGLYLLLATQRPDKVHQNVLSQCDNLILMKMNSATDLRSLSETFSYAPPALVHQAAGFGLGEGLAAGRIAPDPLLFKSGRRLTLEGGSDVPSTWARRP